MKVAILTNFTYFDRGYSLTGIVEDQAELLLRHGHEVTVFANESCNPKCYESRAPLARVLSNLKLTDYKSIKDLSDDHKDQIPILAEKLVEQLADFDVAFTHDWIFQGWCLPYAQAIKLVSYKLPDLRWLHWIHSVPSAQSDWWRFQRYGRKHKIVFPTRYFRLNVAEQFHCSIEDVRIIPHPKDLRSFADFGSETCSFIDRYPAVMQADFVQILPAGQDRLIHKGLDKVIRIFGSLKKIGYSVCLVVANQWARETTYQQDMDDWESMARDFGLEPGVDFVFTSRFDHPKFETGIPKRMIRELMTCANLFVFPTTHESFGLVVPEAALTGNFLVLNNDLGNQMEIMPDAFQHNFGSIYHTRAFDNLDGWCFQMAYIIAGRMVANETILTRTHARQTYNWDSLYKQYYGPILHESLTWGVKESEAA